MTNLLAVQSSVQYNPIVNDVEENPSCLKKTVHNCAYAVAGMAAGILLASQVPAEMPNQVIMTSGAIALGAVIRAFQQVNFSKSTIRAINDFYARWSLAKFEGIWQIFENIDTKVGKEACLDVMSSQFGYQVANEFFNMIDQKKGSRTYQLVNDDDLFSEEINKGTGYSLVSPTRRMMLYGALSVASAAVTVFGYILPYIPALSSAEGVEVIISTAGWLGTLTGLGACAAQIALSSRKRTLERAEKDEEEQLIMESETPPLSKKEWTWRQVTNTVQLFGTEVLLGSIFAAKMAYPRMLGPAFGLAGLGVGIVHTFRQLKFSALTKSEYHAQQLNNIHPNEKGEMVMNTALKIDIGLTTGLFGALFGWFGYGISQSGWQAQSGIGSLLGGTTVSAFLTYIAEKMFEPGQSNRAINLLRYILIDNNYLLPLGYLFFTSVTDITDVALQLDDTTKLVFGMLGLFTFGMFFGNVTIRNISKNRPSPDYASTAFRFRAFARILQRYTGKLSPSTLPV